jgi:hypothetical protein
MKSPICDMLGIEFRRSPSAIAATWLRRSARWRFWCWVRPHLPETVEQLKWIDDHVDASRMASTC